MTASVRYRSVIPFIILFFFFNGIFLPHGLLYTTLLTPVFLYWLFKINALKKSLLFGLLLLVPIPFQVMAGVDIRSYIISSTLVITTWFFLFTSFELIRRIKTDLEIIFRLILIINMVLVVIAIILLPFGPMRTVVWDMTPISPSIPPFPRLMLFTYEPSYYSLIMAPVFLFFILKVLYGRTKHPLMIAVAVILPLLLSLSFGVIGALVLAILLAAIFYYKQLPINFWRIIFYSFIIVGIILLLVYILWPENPVILRLSNILEGKDTSAKGRLLDSYMFAKDLILSKSLLFGCGPGQIKILAHDLIIGYYQYQGIIPDVVRIPNGMGEMLATYGIYGFMLKIIFELYFFIRFKIWNNLFALSLFIFIFIYQFTGSFLTNVAEAAIWAFVFYSNFKDFSLLPKSLNP